MLQSSVLRDAAGCSAGRERAEGRLAESWSDERELTAGRLRRLEFTGQRTQLHRERTERNAEGFHEYSAE